MITFSAVGLLRSFLYNVLRLIEIMFQRYFTVFLWRMCDGYDVMIVYSIPVFNLQVTVYLTSPSGTRSTLLTRRSYDRSADGFNSWSFMTTHCWGESPNGVWRLEVRNGDSVGQCVKISCMSGLFQTFIEELSVQFVDVLFLSSPAPV